MKLSAPEFKEYAVSSAHHEWKEAEAKACRSEKAIRALRAGGGEPTGEQLEEAHRLRRAADAKLREVSTRLRFASHGHA